MGTLMHLLNLLEVNPFSWGALLAFAGLLWLTIYVCLQMGRRSITYWEEAWTFVVFTGVCVLLSFGETVRLNLLALLPTLQHRWLGWVCLSATLVCIAFLGFSRSLRPKSFKRKKWAQIDAAVLVGGITAGVMAMSAILVFHGVVGDLANYYWGVYFAPGPLYWFYSLCFLAIGGLSCRYILMRVHADRRRKTPEFRCRYLLAGLVCIILAESLFLLLPFPFVGSFFPSSGVIVLLLLGSCLFGYSLLQHNAVVASHTRAAFLHSCISGTVGFCSLVVLLIIDQWLEELPDVFLPDSLILLFSVLLLLGLFQTFGRKIHDLVDRISYRRQAGFARLLLRASTHVSSYEDYRTGLHGILEDLCERTGASWAYLALIHEGGILKVEAKYNVSREEGERVPLLAEPNCIAKSITIEDTSLGVLRVGPKADNSEYSMNSLHIIEWVSQEISQRLSHFMVQEQLGKMKEQMERVFQTTHVHLVPHERYGLPYDEDGRIDKEKLSRALRNIHDLPYLQTSDLTQLPSVLELAERLDTSNGSPLGRALQRELFDSIDSLTSRPKPPIDDLVKKLEHSWESKRILERGRMGKLASLVSRRRSRDLLRYLAMRLWVEGVPQELIGDLLDREVRTVKKYIAEGKESIRNWFEHKQRVSVQEDGGGNSKDRLSP